MPITTPDTLADKYIRSLLVADTDLYALVGERVYQGAASGELPDYPLITFALRSGEGISRKVGGGRWFKAEPVYVVTFYATDEADLLSGAALVLSVLDGASATIDGSTIHSFYVGSQPVNPEEVGSGDALYGQAARFRLFVPAPL